MKSNKKKYRICELVELQLATSYGWEKTIDGCLVQCLLIYHEHEVVSYLNLCPHTGVNLDWIPHQFLDSQSEFIQCAMHGALFTIGNGVCIHGPCVGDRLQTIENEIIDNTIYLIL